MTRVKVAADTYIDLAQVTTVRLGDEEKGGRLEVFFWFVGGGTNSWWLNAKLIRQWVANSCVFDFTENL